MKFDSDEAKLSIVGAARMAYYARRDNRREDARVGAAIVRAICGLFEELGRSAADILLDDDIVDEGTFDSLEEYSIDDFMHFIIIYEGEECEKQALMRKWGWEA